MGSLKVDNQIQYHKECKKKFFLMYSGLAGYFGAENFAQDAKSEFRRILISKSAYFEVRVDFK